MQKVLSMILTLALTLGLNTHDLTAQNSVAQPDKPAAALAAQAPQPTPVATPAPELFQAPVDGVGEPKASNVSFESIDIDGDTVIDLNGTPFYHLRDHGYSSVGLNNGIIDVDAYYGVGLTGTTGKLTLTWHNYTDNGAVPTGISICEFCTQNTEVLPNFTVGAGEPYNIGTSSVENGPFRCDVAWSNGATTPIWFYHNDDQNYYCRTSERSVEYLCYWTDRKNDLKAIMGASGTTPQNSLDDGDKVWAYPVPADYDQSKFRCDNQRWRDLADQLVPDKSVPDGQKVTVIHDWIVDNLAYDHYKVNVLKASRPAYYNDYTGKYNMWDTYVGVCADFATVYCIMLRHVGVPAVGIDYDDEHVWNVVWLDGEWVEIDVTEDITLHVTDWDTTNAVRYITDDRYEAFGRPYNMAGLTAEHDHIDWGMYTYKLVTTGTY